MQRRLAAFVAFLVLLLGTVPAGAQVPSPPTPDDQAELRKLLTRWVAAQEDKPCTERCFLLSKLTLTGKVGEPLAFTLRGQVLAKGEQRIPLFGAPAGVRLDDVTLDGAPATLGFEDDAYYVITAARAFVVRGKLTLSGELALTIPGPVNALDAELTSGRIVEGGKQSGLVKETLHFDPMTPESQSNTPVVFRLSRALRIGKENAFVYRLTMSQSKDLGIVHLPLRYGETVREVSGAAGWSATADDLTLPIAGSEANVTISGTIPKLGTFTPEERSAYEWWLVESDPDHRVALEGQGKLVENGQSPIPPTTPSARTVLLQRGERFEVSAQSLLQGEALAAVARRESRIVVLTGRGELVAEEKIDYENNGLDLLSLDPNGRPIFLATDGAAQRILHAENDRDHVLVPLSRGRHELRFQTLGERSLGSLVGLLAVPMTGHALTASAVDVTVGLPAGVVPLAFFGGDHVRWALARGDLLAVLVGALAAAFAFRTRRTRALGAVATVGLWFFSREVFLVAATCLVVVGAVFLASRFLRGNALLITGGLLVTVGIFSANAAVGAVGEPSRELVTGPVEGVGASSSGASKDDGAGSLDGRRAATPVSLSLPSADTYVGTSRQLVSQDRPFSPRLLYVSRGALYVLELAWAAVVALLVWAHRHRLVAAWPAVRARLGRRPELAQARERLW